MLQSRGAKVLAIAALSLGGTGLSETEPVSHTELPPSGGSTCPPSDELSQSSFMPLPIEYPASPMWEWALAPRVAKGDMSNATCVRLYLKDDVEKNTSGALPEAQWQLNDRQEACITVSRALGCEYRLVAFGPDGSREELRKLASDPQSILYQRPSSWNLALGVEKLDLEGIREAQRGAFERARELGLHVLNGADLEEGKKLSWELRTVSGGTISNETFRGKVVIIDQWATWCTSCRAMGKEIEEILKRYPNQVVVVAINHDSALSFQEILRVLAGLPSEDAGWFNVISRPKGNTPSGAQELWARAFFGKSEFALPAVQVIDSNGIVRKDTRIADIGGVREAVQELLSPE